MSHLMPNVPELTARAQDLVHRAVDVAVDTVMPVLAAVHDRAPLPEEFKDQVTATANELLTLSQDVQAKVVAALKSNA